MVKNIELPQLAWHGTKALNLEVPENWQVETCNMAGHNKPQMKPTELKEAIASPIGMTSLGEYARGKKEVVIIFDDMTRVTRVAEIVPHVLEELATAGIADRQIRFIAACGCHGAMNLSEFERKLGKDVLRRFPAYNHAPYDNCVYAGKTKSGIELYINAEVMKCDLKIGIGSVVPHFMTGFGGGGKIILPGVASYETIVALHTPEEEGFESTVTGMGNIAGNPRRRNIDESAEIAQLDMKIDALVNTWGETTDIFAGAPGPTYAAALEAAKAHYVTPLAENNDIVITNTFAKVNEMVTGLPVAFTSVCREGGDIVLMANAPDGQITHYLLGPFGNTISGKFSLKMKPPPNVNRLIIYSEYPDLASLNYLEDTDKVVLMHDWQDVLKLLQESHGAGTKVAVYPNADIQYWIE